MEWLAKIDLVQVANAVVILVVGLAAGLGFRSGKKAPGTKAPTVEVATDFFDSVAIKSLTTETTGHAIAVTAQKLAIEDQTKAIRSLVDLGREWIAMHVREKEEEEERRLEDLRRRNDQLERDLKEARRHPVDPMRKD